mmetsp:Transcript_2307/g.4275  ORF Transcript_2307/g.4275 Transcript_2307/m.4275 type:complete len:224 (+) Transcript_2307:478-1149(+)
MFFGMLSQDFLREMESASFARISVAMEAMSAFILRMAAILLSMADCFSSWRRRCSSRLATMGSRCFTHSSSKALNLFLPSSMISFSFFMLFSASGIIWCSCLFIFSSLFSLSFSSALPSAVFSYSSLTAKNSAILSLASSLSLTTAAASSLSLLNTSSLSACSLSSFSFLSLSLSSSVFSFPSSAFLSPSLTSPVSFPYFMAFPNAPSLPPSTSQPTTLATMS